MPAVRSQFFAQRNTSRKAATASGDFVNRVAIAEFDSDYSVNRTRHAKTNMALLVLTAAIASILF
jgi:hypothetical protein